MLCSFAAMKTCSHVIRQRTSSVRGLMGHTDISPNFSELKMNRFFFFFLSFFRDEDGSRISIVTRVAYNIFMLRVLLYNSGCFFFPSSNVEASSLSNTHNHCAWMHYFGSNFLHLPRLQEPEFFCVDYIVLHLVTKKTNRTDIYVIHKCSVLFRAVQINTLYLFTLDICLRCWCCFICPRRAQRQRATVTVNILNNVLSCLHSH